MCSFGEILSVSGMITVFTSLRTQTYFRLSLVSAENNVCEPEPGNDFCDVMTFVSPWPIRFHDKMALECSSQRIPRAVVLRLLELSCDWLKILTSEKSFPGSGSQTLFFSGDKRQPEIRLRSQAMSSRKNRKKQKS